jgi:hemoglobin-like flavoprotein
VITLSATPRRRAIVFGQAGAGPERPVYADARPPAESLRSVQFSCQLLSRNQGWFIESFYESMVVRVPQVRAMPPRAGRPLCNRLAQSVLWAALTQDAPEAVEAALRQVGGGIQQQGFFDGWYRSFGAALLDTVRQIHKREWGSRLSSDWIAFYTWLSGNLRLGADAARSGFAPALDTVDDQPGEQRLSEILAALRTRYFPADDRGLTTICTRVALRTGVDLYAPRPDHQADTAVVSRVLGTLLVLGFSLSPSPHDLPAHPPDQEDGNRHQADGEPVVPAGLWQRFRRLLNKADV